jgi:hypothetical protein
LNYPVNRPVSMLCHEGSVAGHVGGPLLKIVVDAGLPALVFFMMVVVGKAWPDAA